MKPFVSTLAGALFPSLQRIRPDSNPGGGNQRQVRTNETIDVKNVNDTRALLYRCREPG